MIEVTNLVKDYGNHHAVKGISFTVGEGQIVGLLGPNGAGKSTTMNILTGYLSATEGRVLIDGHEILEEPTEAKKCIGYLPELPPLYPDMVVRKYLEFMFDLKKVTLPKKEHIEEVCKVARITDVANRLIKNLSKGYKQRVGLAQALLGNPPVLILDEPTVGLDPKQIIEMRTLIKGLGKKHTVILSSHVLPEVQATCDRVIVINQGKLVADSATSALSDTLSGTHNLLVQIAGNETAVMSAIKNINGVLKMERLRSISSDCTEYVIKTEKDKDVRRQIFFAMAKAEYPIVLMKNAELSLEDAFLQLTGNSAVVGKKGGKWS